MLSTTHSIAFAIVVFVSFCEVVFVWVTCKWIVFSFSKNRQMKTVFLKNTKNNDQSKQNPEKIPVLLQMPNGNFWYISCARALATQSCLYFFSFLVPIKIHIVCDTKFLMYFCLQCEKRNGPLCRRCTT